MPPTRASPDEFDDGLGDAYSFVEPAEEPAAEPPPPQPSTGSGGVVVAKRGVPLARPAQRLEHRLEEPPLEHALCLRQRAKLVVKRERADDARARARQRLTACSKHFQPEDMSKAKGACACALAFD